MPSICSHGVVKRDFVGISVAPRGSKWAGKEQRAFEDRCPDLLLPYE